MYFCYFFINYKKQNLRKGFFLKQYYFQGIFLHNSAPGRYNTNTRLQVFFIKMKR